MIIIEKDDSVDITRRYFNHPIWKCNDPTPNMPLDVQLELVNTCNLSCDSCPITYTNRPKSTLSWEILQDIVNQSAMEGVAYFTICGIGEAALHPNLFDLLRHIRLQQVEVEGLRLVPMMPSVLISNAMWSSSQIQQCLNNPPDLLSISLAGLTDEEATKRRHPLNIEKLEKVVSTIYQNRKTKREVDGGTAPTIHISTHIYPNEFKEEKKLKAFQDRWLPICDAIVIKPTMLDVHLKEYSKFLCSKYRNISKNHYTRTVPCRETSRRLSIASNGDVWCGHHNLEDFGHVLGNVYSQTLRQIWHGETMKQFREGVSNGVFHRPNCQACGGELRDSK